MKTQADNPFSGLKAAFSRIASGFWASLLFNLLYRRKIEACLAGLEALFAQWKAGTLPLPPTPPEIQPAQATPELRPTRARTTQRRRTPRLRQKSPRQARARRPFPQPTTTHPTWQHTPGVRVKPSARCTKTRASQVDRSRPFHYDIAIK
jgi:hypothetical protein